MEVIKMDELPPLDACAKLPSMLTLYQRDLYYVPTGLWKECLEMVVRITCKFCRDYPKLWPFVMDFIQVGNSEVLEALEKRQPGWTPEHLKRYIATSTKGEIYAYLSRTFDIYLPSTTRHRMIKERGQEAEVLRIEHHLSWEQLITDKITIPDTSMQDALDTAKAKEVEKLLMLLPTKEREAIQLYYGIEGHAHTSTEIAALYDVTRDHAKLLVNTAHKRLKGEHVKDAREWIDQDRPQRLQAIYDAHQGNIGVRQLATLAKVHHRFVGPWIKEQRKEARSDIV